MSKPNIPKKVLIVDDDLSLQKILLDELQRLGIAATAVATGEEAFIAAKNQLPDLILLDIMLKGNLNGFDVLEELKRNEMLKPIPVIVLTNLEGERKSALNIGAIDYIEKANISIEEVVLKVKNVLGA
jgi:DNA-binding response OmpR family regulator